MTQHVLKICERPVFVTTGKNWDCDYRFRSHRILCLVGLDGQDAELLWHASELVSKTGSELILLHVVPQVNEALLYHAIEPSRRPLSSVRAETELRRLGRCLDVPATASVQVGDPSQWIAKVAHEQRVDLVLTSRGNVSMQPDDINYVAEVLPLLCCPMLTIPRQSAPQSEQLAPVVSPSYR